MSRTLRRYSGSHEKLWNEYFVVGAAIVISMFIRHLINWYIFVDRCHTVLFARVFICINCRKEWCAECDQSAVGLPCILYLSLALLCPTLGGTAAMFTSLKIHPTRLLFLRSRRDRANSVGDDRSTQNGKKIYMLSQISQCPASMLYPQASWGRPTSEEAHNDQIAEASG